MAKYHRDMNKELKTFFNKNHAILLHYYSDLKSESTEYDGTLTRLLTQFSQANKTDEATVVQWIVKRSKTESAEAAVEAFLEDIS